MAGAGPRVQYPSPSCCSSHSPRPTAPPRRPFGPPFALLLLQLLPPASRPLLDTAQQEVAQPLPAGVSGRSTCSTPAGVVQGRPQLARELLH